MTILPIGLLAILFAFSAGLVLSDANAQTAVLSEIDSFALPDNGYRHNLIHLSDEFYVSSHTAIHTSATDENALSSVVYLRLYTIINGEINLIRDLAVTPTGGGSESTVRSETENPNSTGLARVDVDRLALSYTSSGTNIIRTYNVTISSPNPDFVRDKQRVFQSVGDANNHSLVALDKETLVLSYSLPDGSPDGYVQLFSIPHSGITLDLENTLRYTDIQGRYPSLVKLDDDRVVLAYRTVRAQVYIQTVDIVTNDMANDTLNARLAFTTIDSDERTAYNSLIRVDDNTVALAYSRIGMSTNLGDGDGRIRVFDVADTTGAISSTGSGAVFYDDAETAGSEERIHLSSLALLDSDTIAVAYRGEGGAGFIRLYDIASNGALTANGEPLEHDSANGAFNSLIAIDDTTLALVYGGDLARTDLSTSSEVPNTIKLFSTVSDVMPPTILSAETTDSNTIVLTASELLEGMANIGDFTVSSSTLSGHTVFPNTVTAAEISGSTIILTTGTVISGGTITIAVEYRGNSITDGVGNALARFTDQSVSNREVGVPIITSVSATPGTYKIGDTIDITVTLNTSVFVSNSNGRLELNFGTITREVPISSSVTNSNTITLPFPYTVATGDTSANLNYVDTNSFLGSSGHFTGPEGLLNLALPPTTSADSLGGSNIIVTGIAPIISTAVTTGSTTIVLTASEALTGTIATGDFTVDGNTVMGIPILSDGTTITITVDTAIIGGNTVTVDYGGTALVNAAGNALATFDDRPVTNNEAPIPVITDVSATGGPYTAGNTVPITVTYDLAVRVVGNPELLLATGDPVAGTPNTPAVYHSSPTPTTLLFNYMVAATDNSADLNYVGTDSLTLSGSDSILSTADSAVASLTLPDPSVNSFGGSNIVVDNVAPFPSINRAVPTNPTLPFDIEYAVLFSEPVTGLMASEIMVTGTASGGSPVVSDFVGTPPTDRYTFNVEITADGTVEVTIPAGVAMDRVNIGNTALLTSVIDTIDTTAPFYRSAVTTDANTITITVSEPLDESVDAVASDFSVTSNGIANGLTALPEINDNIITLRVGTPILGGHAITVQYSGMNLIDAAGNALEIFTRNPTNTLDVPTTPAVTGVTGLGGFYFSGFSIDIEVTFDEAVTVSTESGIPRIILDTGVTGGTAVNYVRTESGGTVLVFDYSTAPGHNSEKLNYVNTGSLILNGGSINAADDANPADLTLPAVASTASLGNSNIVVDTVIPSVTISSDNLLTKSRSITFTAEFTEDVTGFVDTTNDIVVSGAATTVTTITPVNGTHYDFVVDATADGAVTVSIPADAAMDRADNGNTVSDPYTITVDTVAPTVTISTDTANGGSQNTNTISYNVDFSEGVHDFVEGDITVTGTAPFGTPAIRNFNEVGPEEYTFDVVTTDNGTVLVTIPAGVATDDATNGNEASATYTVTVDDDIPTVTISATDSAGTATANGGSQNDNTISYTATFSKPVTGFEIDDITISGSAPLGTPAVTNFDITNAPEYTFDVVTTNDGTVLVSIAENVAADTAGNGNAASGVYTVTVDNVVPTVMLGSTTTAVDGGSQNTSIASYTVMFSEDVENFVEGDITVTGTASGGSPGVSSFAGIGASYTFNVETSADGTVEVTIPAGVAADAAGNLNTESLMHTITVDTTVPTVGITTDTANGGSQNTNTISYTATFSEAVNNFVVDDITVTGTASGGSPTATIFDGSGASYTFNVVTSADGTVEVMIPANVATDTANNDNMESGTYTVTVDTLAPTIMSVETTDSTTIVITALEPLAEITPTGVFTVTDNTVNGIPTISGSTITIIVGTSIVFGDTPEVTYVGTDLTDVAGNALEAITDRTVTNNVPVAGAPVVTGVAAPPGSYKEGDTINITVTFNEAVTVSTTSGTPQLTLETGDPDAVAVYTLTGSTGTALIFEYTVAAGENSADLNYVSINSLDLNGGTIVAVAPGATPASTTLPAITAVESLGGSSAVIVDTMAPTVVITNIQTTNIGGFSSSRVLTFIATFSEEVNNFVVGDITVGGTATVTAAASVMQQPFGDRSIYTIAVTAPADGTVVVSIPLNAAADDAGNGNMASDPYTITVDTAAPTVTITADDVNANGFTNSAAITYNAKFNEVVSDFDNANDITLGGTATATVSAPTAINGTDYTFVVTSTADATSANDGTVVVSIPVNAVSDAAGNNNAASAPYTVTIDTVVSGVQITTITDNDGTQNSNTISYSAVFGEAVTGFDLADIDVSGTASNNAPVASIFSGSGLSYAFDVVVASGDGTVIVRIPANMAVDRAGNGHTASNTYTVTVDTALPTVEITADGVANGGSQTTDTVSYTATFNEEVVNFVVADIEVSGTASFGTPAVTDFDATNAPVYTFDVMTTDDGTVVVSIPEGAATDAGTNGNVASGDHTVTVDTSIPSVTGVAATGGSYMASDRIDIIVTFDEQVEVTGEPTLTLDTGAVVSFNAFVDTSRLTLQFPYTVTAGQNSDDLNYVDVDSLDLSGGSITAFDNGIPASLLLPATTLDDSLGGSDVIVDTTAPRFLSAQTTTPNTIEIIISEPLDQTMTAGTFTVATNTVSGTPVISGSTITITVGMAITSADTLTVSYTTDTGGIADIAGNALETFANPETVTNNVPDATAPTVLSVSAPPGTHTTGATIDITVAFDEAVDVTGVPQLTLDTGAVVDYTSGTGGTDLLFQYTVAAGENSADLNYANVNSLALNSGTINVAGGTTAVNLVLPATTAATSLGGSSAVIVDTTAPTVTISNDQTTSDGETATTRTLDYTVEFSETVTGFAMNDITVSGAATAPDAAPAGSDDTYTFTVTAPADGTVTVSIPAGAAADEAGNDNIVSADYTVIIDATAPTIMSAATSGSTTIVITASEPLAEITPTGDFTVTDNTVNGIPTISGSTITIIVGTSIVFGDTPEVTYVGTDLTDVAGNALAAITSQTVTNNVPVAGVPVVTGVAAPPGTHNAGDTIDITVTFNEAVDVTGTPQLTLETGDTDAVADYTSTGSTGTALIFEYTVAAGENSADLNYVGTTSLDLNGGTILAEADSVTPASLTLPATTDATSLGGSSAVVVDAVVPTVTISASVDNDGSTNDGSVFYTATFSEDVTGFDVAADITVSGTAAATLTTPTGSGSTYTFAATTTNGGTITVLIPADAAADTATNGNTASATYTVTVNSLSQINSLDLTPGGYRHNLVHFTGDYYVSSHTVTRANSDDAALWNFDTVLNLYSIIGGDITLIGSRTVETRTQDKTTTINEFTTHPRSTAVTAVDDDTIAVTYVASSTSRLRTYDVDTASTTAPFGTSVLTSLGTSGTLTQEQTHNHSLVTLDATRLVVAYSYPDASTTNYIQIINVVSGTGALTPETPVEITDTLGQYSSLVRLDGNTVVVAYRADANEYGYLRAYNISADNTIAPGDAVQIEGSRIAHTSLIRVDDDTVAVAYSALGLDTSTTDGQANLKVYNVDTNAAITGGTGVASSVYYDDAVADVTFEEHAHLNSLALLNTDTLAVAYRGDGPAGNVRLYDIDLSTNGLTARGEAFVHDTVNGAFNSLVSINDETLALVYGGDLPSVIANTDTPNTIKTLAVLGPDTTVPTIVAAVTSDANTIVLTASEFLARTAATPVFTVPGNAVTGTVILGTTVTITVDTQISLGDTPTINYAVGGAITDAAGNALAAFAALPVTNNVDDATRPTAIITNADIADGDTTLTDTTASYTVTFNEPVPGFDVADIIISGTASGGAPVPSNFETATADISYTFDVVTTSDGTVIVSVPENVAADPAGNQNTASNTYTITVDAEVPEIVSARLSTDTITIIYSKLVTTDASHYDDVMSPAGTPHTIDSFIDATPDDANYTVISLILSTTPAGTTATIDIAGPTKTSDSTSALSPLEDYPVTAEVNVVLDATDNRIAVTDFDSTLATVRYPSTVDATLDYSSLIDGESVTPTATTNTEIVVTATGIRGGDIQVTIPATTTFSSSTFDGILILPTDSGSGCDSTAITSGAQASCIEIGQAGSVINTDKPIRIQLGGQAGNVPWYSQGGAAATQITVACDGDDLVTVSAQLDGTGECFINTDRDLIIWTAHFTVFGSNLVTPPPVVVVAPESEPTPASEPAPRRSGGGGHGNTLDPRVCGGVLCSEQGSNSPSSGTPSTSRSSSDQIRTVPRVTPEQTQEPDRTQNGADPALGTPEPEPSPLPKTPEPGLTNPAPGSTVDPEPGSTNPAPGLLVDPEPGSTNPAPGLLVDPEPGSTSPAPGLLVDPEPGSTSPAPGLLVDPEPGSTNPAPGSTVDPEPGSTVDPEPEQADGIFEQIGRWFTSLFG